MDGDNESETSRRATPEPSRETIEIATENLTLNEATKQLEDQIWEFTYDDDCTRDHLYSSIELMKRKVATVLNAYKNRQESLENWENELSAREEKMEERESSATDRDTALTEREAALAEKEEKLDTQLRQLEHDRQEHSNKIAEAEEIFRKQTTRDEELDKKLHQHEKTKQKIGKIEAAARKVIEDSEKYVLTASLSVTLTVCDRAKQDRDEFTKRLVGLDPNTNETLVQRLARLSVTQAEDVKTKSQLEERARELEAENQRLKTGKADLERQLNNFRLSSRVFSSQPPTTRKRSRRYSGTETHSSIGGSGSSWPAFEFSGSSARNGTRDFDPFVIFARQPSNPLSAREASASSQQDTPPSLNAPKESGPTTSHSSGSTSNNGNPSDRQQNQHTLAAAMFQETPTRPKATAKPRRNTRKQTSSAGTERAPKRQLASSQFDHSIEDVLQRVHFWNPSKQTLESVASAPDDLREQLATELQPFRTSSGFKTLNSTPKSTKCNIARNARSQPDGMDDDAQSACAYCNNHAVMCMKACTDGRAVVMPRPAEGRMDLSWEDPQYWIPPNARPMQVD